MPLQWTAVEQVAGVRAKKKFGPSRIHENNKKSLTSVKKHRRKKTKFERVGEMLLPSVRQPAQRLNEKTRTEQEELNKGKKTKHIGWEEETTLGEIEITFVLKSMIAHE